MADLKNRIISAGLCAFLVFTGSFMLPMHAEAAENDEILLGAFWTSDEDNSDTLYFSTDGINFYEICEPYTDATEFSADSNISTILRRDYELDETGEHILIDGFKTDGSPVWHGTKERQERIDATLHDPSIIYNEKLGGFLMISGFSDGSGSDRRVIPMIGFSKDLIHWSVPASGSETNIRLSETPKVDSLRTPLYNEDSWDMVAPDFLTDDDGSIYIVFSIGYFALFHDEDERQDKAYYDEMYPYICKLDIEVPKLEVYNSQTSQVELWDPDPAFYPEMELKCTYSDVIPIKLPCMESRKAVAHNHIDASLYKEDGYYYYSVKENGVTTEIFRTKDLSKASDQASWEEVCYDVITGYEGPCLTKYDGEYLLYTDRLATFKPTDLKGKQSKTSFGSAGTWVVKATTGTTGKLDAYTGWLENNIRKVNTFRKNGLLKPNRHGTVITLSGKAAEIVRSAAKAAGYRNDKLYGNLKEDDWFSFGWYHKETYVDPVVFGEDSALCKFYYENEKRIGTSLDNPLGAEKKPGGDDNMYFFKANSEDPGLDGRMLCASTIDAYNRGIEVEACLPVDWDYYNEVGAEKYGNANTAWVWRRYNWEGKPKKGHHENKATGEWYYYEPIYGNMVKGAYRFVNSDGIDCYIWFDPVTGVRQNNVDFTANRRKFHTNDGGFAYYRNPDGAWEGTPVKEPVLPTVKYHSPREEAYQDEGHPENGWYKPDGEDGKWYWYENGSRQGNKVDPLGVYGGDKGDATNRGREICDLDMTDKDGIVGVWFWLDSVLDGARAVGKEVWIPYIFQDEGTWTVSMMREAANGSDEGMRDLVFQCMLEGRGKWVRYDENGRMMKGWVTIEGEELESLYPDQIGNTYYYDTKTGLMAKGYISIGGKQYHFDEITGVLQR